MSLLGSVKTQPGEQEWQVAASLKVTGGLLAWLPQHYTCLNSNDAIPKVRGCHGGGGSCLCFTKTVLSSVSAVQGVVLTEARLPQGGWLGRVSLQLLEKGDTKL